MATTQCPHCFTVYKISDRQYRETQGNVRCGTCHERFSAVLMEEQEAAQLDPEDLSIEPISKPQHEDVPSLDEIVSREAREAEYDFNVEGNIQSELSIDMDDDEGPASFDDEDSVEYELKGYPFSSQETGPPTVAESDFDRHPATGTDPLEAEPPEPEHPEPEATEPEATELKIEEPQQDKQSDALIEQVDEVDQLIDDKLLSTAEGELPDQEQMHEEPEDSIFREPSKRSQWRSWVGIPLLLLIVLLLGAALVYQLWLRQALPISANMQIPEKLIRLAEPVIKPLETQLSKRFDTELPVRRDLPGLELVSARTSPHPTRSSTTLLKVNIANRSDISQPLPWLELSLTDRNGQLVARRALMPEDYIYKNDTLNKIGPRELKPVTIELLTFPEQVTGYELKLLDK
ncbi:MAG: zinc-ribbon domain-containing protein [Arenicella sp.]|nr:zinc-ribbon domain-containing protein [Arenicella sp.]